MPDDGGGTHLARHLIGRDAELAALQATWRDGGTTRVVTSAAGVGKSRLLRELASWASGQGGVVLVGRARPTDQETPLRPWREALLGAARTGRRPAPDLDPFVPSLARLVPEWGEPGDDPSPLLLGEALLRLLSAWATPAAGVLLVLEDLQWADAESLSVLEYVVDNLAGLPILVALALRDDEPSAGKERVDDLVARRDAIAVPIGPLTDDEVLAVARSCLGGDELPAEVADALVARSEGVPFLVEELLATAVRSGWDAIAADVPGSVVTSVATRLRELPEPAPSLLTTAALLGRQFDWTLAATAAGVAEDEAAEVLRLAVRAQLLDVEGPGFRFRHALTRDAVLASTLPAARVAAARHTFDLLRAAAPSGEQLALAAQLGDAAGLHEEAAPLWLQAAEWALDGGALESAATLAERARAGGDEVTSRAAALVLLRTFTLAGRTSDADQLGAELLASSADDDERTEVHLLLGSVALTAGRWDDADAHATTVRALTDEPACRARADALAAHAAMGRLEPDVAVTLARSAVEAARATDQPEVVCEALEIIGRAERGRDLEAAETAFQEAHDLAAAEGLRVHRTRAMQELGTIDMFGSLSLDRLLAARHMAEEAGALAMAAVVDLQVAAAHEARGEVAECLEVARRCEEASRRWGLATLPMSMLVQGFAHAQVGDAAAAEACVAAARATGQDRHHVEARALGNVQARLQVVAGDLPGAIASMDAAMALIRADPGATHVFPGEWALLRTLLDADGDAARAEVAALAVDTPVSRKYLQLAEAVAAGRAGDPDAALTRFTAADTALATPAYAHHRAYLRHLVAPAAHADGWGDPAAWLRESLATFEASGHDVLAARCRTLLKEIGAPVPRKGRGETTTVPPELAALGITSREADVLSLVADGATNREVAERLFISPRTVDKHVERLLQKAGTTRSGLAELAQRAGLRT